MSSIDRPANHSNLESFVHYAANTKSIRTCAEVRNLTVRWNDPIGRVVMVLTHSDNLRSVMFDRRGMSGQPRNSASQRFREVDEDLTKQCKFVTSESRGRFSLRLGS
jgi:hypothetical protein